MAKRGVLGGKSVKTQSNNMNRCEMFINSFNKTCRGGEIKRSKRCLHFLQQNSGSDIYEGVRGEGELSSHVEAVLTRRLCVGDEEGTGGETETPLGTHVVKAHIHRAELE